MRQHPNTTEPPLSARPDDEFDGSSMVMVPAWLLSSVLHLIVVIALVVLVGRIPAKTIEEPPRPVSIALIDRSSNSSPEYLTDEQARPETGSNSGPRTPVVPMTAPPVIPKINLPARSDVQIGPANSDQLVAVPRLTRQGRGPILPGVNDDAILAEEAARRQGPANPGEPGMLSLFGGGAIVGNRFIFVIDRSKSMGAEGLGALLAASRELQRELRRLEPRHAFQIIAYNHTPLYMGERNLLAATPENIGRVRNYFAGLAAYGATAHESALLSALRRKPDVIVFLTDGGDPYLNDSQLVRIQSRAGKATAIHCIQFGYGAPDETSRFMQQLAAQNRGSYRYVDMARWPPKE